MADAKKIKIGGTWYTVKDETARNGLAGKVSKSGDTMTGQLQINRAANDIAVVTKLTSSGRSSLPSSNEDIYSSVIIDKDMNWIGMISHTLQTSGRVLFTIGAINKPTDSTIFNTLAFGIDQNGNLSIGVSSPVAWRNGLGASNGVWPTSVGGTGGTDSGWQALTAGSDVNSGTIKYRKIGSWVEIRGKDVKLKSTLTASYLTLLNVPSAIRPNEKVALSSGFKVASSGVYEPAYCELAISGNINLCKPSVVSSITTNDLINFSAMYFV